MKNPFRQSIRSGFRIAAYYRYSLKDMPRMTQNMGATIQTEKEKKAWTA